MEVHYNSPVTLLNSKTRHRTILVGNSALFAGTVDAKLAPQVSALLAKLQPKAVCFQGPTATQGVRWPGSESGDAPEPNWSTANSSVDFGPGRPDAPEFVPTESDVTLSRSGQWYWIPGQVLKTLPALIAIYERTVGHNANLVPPPL